MSVLKQIAELAEPLRAPTFTRAAEFILSLDKPVLVETGCFRGETGDGQSTVILAMLARETGGKFFSYELNQDHIHQAALWLDRHALFATFILGDSAETLKLFSRPISFAYLDSYDFEVEKFPASQQHQLKEVEILLPKMAATSGFLLDDCDLPLGGKAGLSAPLILEHGYTEVLSGYQRLLLRQ